MKETGRSTQHCFPVNFFGFFFDRWEEFIAN